MIRPAKAIDSNLLVYASLEGHPASTPCEQYLQADHEWITNILNLFEFHRVLVRVYSASRDLADRQFADLCHTLTVASLTSDLAETALRLEEAHGVDFNDAVLIETC